MSGADPRREFKGHQLPRPKRPLDPLRDPFVGNKSVSDNLCEMVQAVLWSTLGSKAHALSVNVSETTVTLAGTLDSEAERATAVATAKSVRGIVSVADQIDVRKAGSAPSGVETSPARMVYLRRFCSMDEASTSAAIRQAVSELDALFSDTEILPQNLVVIYSNILGGTVTLDVGVPCSRPSAPTPRWRWHHRCARSDHPGRSPKAAGSSVRCTRKSLPRPWCLVSRKVMVPTSLASGRPGTTRIQTLMPTTSLAGYLAKVERWRPTWPTRASW